MVGSQAGLQAGKQKAGPDRPSRSSSSREARGGGLGLPDMAVAKPADYRHLLLLAQHRNMTDLGLDVPFGINATNNGEFRSMFEPGKVPFDWFWDT